MVALKVIPVNQYSIVIFTFSGLWDCKIQHLFGNRVALDPGLGGVRDVAPAIISPEHTQIKPSLLFSNFGCCVSKGSLLDYLELTTAAVMPCGGPKSLPVHR